MASMRWPSGGGAVERPAKRAPVLRGSVDRAVEIVHAEGEAREAFAARLQELGEVEAVVQGSHELQSGLERDRVGVPVVRELDRPVPVVDAEHRGEAVDVLLHVLGVHREHDVADMADLLEHLLGSPVSCDPSVPPDVPTSA
jgi:hypothetical protein